jgi:hypothetical protein
MLLIFIKDARRIAFIHILKEYINIFEDSKVRTTIIGHLFKKGEGHAELCGCIFG